MKYCVFVFGAILACCCAQAHVRYDFSMGPIGSEKMFLRGLHSAAGASGLYDIYRLTTNRLLETNGKLTIRKTSHLDITQRTS